MDQLKSDLRYACRGLSKSPFFAAVGIASLGLALALNTTMFALVDAVWHPIQPYPHSERLVVPSFRGGDPKHWVDLGTRYRAVRDGMRSYERIAAFTRLEALIQTPGRTATDGTVMSVSSEFFNTLGVRPLRGRVIGLADSGSSNNQAAVISFRLWNRLFDGRPLTDTLRLDIGGYGYAVVGVMPPGVHAPEESGDIWIPSGTLPPDSAEFRFGPSAVIRLKAGVTIPTAWSELDLIAKRLTADYSPNRPLSTWLKPINGTRASVQLIPWYIEYTIAMVLIIACANLGTMMFARGLARRREHAIRIAVGARPSHLIRGVLAECSIIVLLGAMLGTLLTYWALYLLPHFTIPSLPDFGDLRPTPSPRVFAFVLLLASAVVLAAGAGPAWRAARVDPAEPMKDGAGTTTGRRRDRYNLLIVVEVALSTALLMCCVLFMLSAVRLSMVRFNYAATRLVTTDLLPRSRVPDTLLPRFYEHVIARAAAVPHARHAATHHGAAPDGKMVLAEQGKMGDTWMNLRYYDVVSTDFFSTLGIPIRKGRTFEAGDAYGASPVVIVDEDAAKRLWPDVSNPVGHLLKLGDKESTAPWLRVIGVAAHVELELRKDADLPPTPMIYVVDPKDMTRGRQLVIQGDGAGPDNGRMALSMAVRRQLENSTPALGGIWVRSWLMAYDNQRAASSFLASLFGVLAAFGVVLCAVGLYGVLGYTVNRRIRELAVHIALGARRRDVARLVVYDATVTALGGVGIGAFLALRISWSFADAVSDMAYAYPAALVGAEAILFGVSFLAAFSPIRRAVAADPIVILRAG